MTKKIANNHNEVKQILANVDVAVLRENVWKFMDSERDKINWDKTKGISCSVLDLLKERRISIA